VLPATFLPGRMAEGITMEYLSATFFGFFLPLVCFAALSVIAAVLEYFTNK